MKKTFSLSLLIIIQFISIGSFAQQLTDEWRLTKKAHVNETDGVNIRWEYFYEKDGRIQKVKFFQKGELISVDSKFKFNNNGKITSFSSTGADAELLFTAKIQYDDKGRVSKITGADVSGEQIHPTNTYSYSGNKTTVLKVPVILGTSADITKPYYEHMEFYTEKGDYIEMTEEQPSEIQKWNIFPGKNPKALLEPDPDSFTAGYESFLLWAFRGASLIMDQTALASKITKDKNGLIVSVVMSRPVAGKTYTDKIYYSYTKISAGAGKNEVSEAKITDKPEKEAPVFRDDKAHYDPSQPVLKTNIKCEAGKTKIIKALKKLDGVFEVKIDIKTGLLKLNYSSDGTSFNEIIDAILDNGFDVTDDGLDSGPKRSAKPADNPCKTKTAK